MRTVSSAIVTTAAGETEVAAGDGSFYGVVLSNAAAASTVLIEDGTSPIGTFKNSAAAADSKVIMLPHPHKFTGGLNITVAGVGADATVFFGA